MKSAYLLFLTLVMIAFLGFLVPQASADDTNGISIQNIQVQPSTIKVGDPIRITATLVNNSTVPIFVSDMINNDCQGPFFTVSFDNHVKVVVAADNERTCSYVGLQKTLDPGKKYTGTSPGLFFTYTTTQSGTANATVTFPYKVKNQTDPNQSNIDQTISKSFLFTIYDNNTTISIPHSEPPIQSFSTPLQQFKSGIVANNVTCNQGLKLILKSEDGSPACVKPDTAQKLIERGWAWNYANVVGNESISLSAYQGVSNEAFYNNGTVVSNFTIDVNINNFKPSNASLVLHVYYNDGTLYKTVSIPSDTVQSDGFYKYHLIAMSDKNHSVPFKIVATYNKETAMTYAPVFTHP